MRAWRILVLARGGKACHLLLLVGSLSSLLLVKAEVACRPPCTLYASLACLQHLNAIALHSFSFIGWLCYGIKGCCLQWVWLLRHSKIHNRVSSISIFVSYLALLSGVDVSIYASSRFIDSRPKSLAMSHGLLLERLPHLADSTFQRGDRLVFRHFGKMCPCFQISLIRLGAVSFGSFVRGCGRQNLLFGCVRLRLVKDSLW